jgi:molybdopterin-guanine dinucleotide biosynthesis protein MobB
METDFQKEKGLDWLFHPFEFAFCGYSDSGKTTVLLELIKELSKQYKIGYVKHNAHGFQIDREGKDTYRAMSQGAYSYLINDYEHFAEVHLEPLDTIRQRTALLGSDILFIEGYKTSSAPKFIFTGRDKNIVKELQENRLANIIGLIGMDDRAPEFAEGHPYFHSRDITGIKNRILEIISEKIKKTKLYGLILTGGMSSRMNREKCLLSYHGVSQVDYCHDLLSRSCEKVFVSSRREQASKGFNSDIPRILDRFLDMGPLGGILTAMFEYPRAAWLVLGCDMPFVDNEVLSKLIQERNPLKMATAFVHDEKHYPEPLCTIYEPKILPWFFQSLGAGHVWPIKDLSHTGAKTIYVENGYKLKSVNTPEEYIKALRELQNQG